MENISNENPSNKWLSVPLIATVTRALVKRTSDRHNWSFRGVTFIISPTDYESLRSVRSFRARPTGRSRPPGGRRRPGAKRVRPEPGMTAGPGGNSNPSSRKSWPIPANSIPTTTRKSAMKSPVSSGSRATATVAARWRNTKP